MKQKITWVGNCTGCGKVQESTDKSEVDIRCWDCSVNANVERRDIISDIEKEIKTSNSSSQRLNNPGLNRALEIIRKYDR